MKRNQFVSSSRRKNRKRHFAAPSHIRGKIMSAPLSKDLRTKYTVRSMPVVKDDVVKIEKGRFRSENDYKIIKVFRKKYVIHCERVQRDKANGLAVHIGIHPSNVTITKLKLNKNRQHILDRKSAGRLAAKTNKEKYTEDVN
ncbi:hypothetical protein A3Q56_05529 [Intoshia linei]|uniref:60S ribosomal protein L26 n=1 Tax=Intoshia linei TaxID=1819745 RepID=A0A177AXM4_9BILA|nr:hypothetical protein A3Q56_05529 [Intoshia linei]